MATNQVQVDKIIAYLLTKTAITNVVGQRIYWGEPIEEQSSFPYIVISIVSESNQEANKSTLLEFRLVAGKNNTFKSLVDLRNILTNNLLGVRNLTTFSVYAVTEKNFRQGYDAKDYKVILQDYRFYFVN